MPAFILEKMCRGCKHCVNACPEQAITVLAYLPVVDPAKCTECETCIELCMHGAITFKASEEKKDMNEQELRLQLDVVSAKLVDLKARWPYHSVQASMVSEREDLEEERDRLLLLLKAT